jgi:hypothetical protein
MTGADTVTITAAELEAMLARAAEAGAKKALAGVGLHDDDAQRDVRDLRDLIESWRDAKREIGRTLARMLTTALLAALAAGAAVTWWRN